MSVNDNIEKVVVINSDNTIEETPEATSLKAALQKLVKYAMEMEEAEQKLREKNGG